MGGAVRHKSRRTAALLAVVFGVLGIHKFYVGNWRAGLVQLAAAFAAAMASSAIGVRFPFSIVGALSAVEGIVYALMTDDAFETTYVIGRRAFL